MTIFWFLAGVLTALATLVLVQPWMRRIPLLGPLPAVAWQTAMGACVTVAAVLAMYQWLGHSEPLEQSRAPAATKGFREAVRAFNNSAAGRESPAMPTSAAPMSGAIAALESRLAKGGGSVDDWELLAKSFEFLGRPDDAAQARARKLPLLPLNGVQPAAVPAAAAELATPMVAPTLSPESLKLLGNANSARQNKQMQQAAAIYAELAARGQMNADGWADYADVAATLQGGKLAGEPETYVAKSLALDPRHPKALWLKASADQEAGRYAKAVIVWRQLQAVLGTDSADAKMVAANLQQDMKLADKAAAGAATASASGTAVAVSGEVSLTPRLSAKAAAGATLFIIAKSVDSPGAPVAVLRRSVGAWPVEFTLDDSQSMLPGRNLSSAGRVTVEARVSRGGQPQPAKGDLQGTTGVINPADHRPLKILIDHEII